MDPLAILCRDILIEVSRRRSTITYGELARRLGVGDGRNVTPYLDAVYNDVVINQGLPHLTLLVVYSGTHYGNYNSRGGPARSVVVVPTNPVQLAAYDADRELVYRHWA